MGIPMRYSGGVTVSHVLLGLLEEGDRHGYDLKQSYDRKFGAFRPLRFGQVYRTLAQLQRDGLVEIVGVEAGAGPERKRYSITVEGVTDLERWQSEPEDPQPHLQTVLFQKVVLERHLAVMRELTAARRTASPQESLHIDYQLFHIEADLRWIDHAATRLGSLTEVIEV